MNKHTLQCIQRTNPALRSSQHAGRRGLDTSLQWELLEVIRKMIRIITADEPALTMITVDGQLAGDNIQAVETICDQARSNGKPIRLFCGMSQQSAKMAKHCCAASPRKVSA